MSEALLTLDHAAKSHGGKPLLDVASIDMRRGELIVLSGDNGSGKTTLLKMLAGLEASDRLRMRFDGFEASEASYPRELRRMILYVHQHPYLFNSSIADNIAYGLRLRSMPAGERARRVDDAIAWAGAAMAVLAEDYHLAHTPPRRERVEQKFREISGHG